MIVVTKIDIQKVDREEYRLAKHIPLSMVKTNEEYENFQHYNDIEEEMIYGQRFVNKHGEEFCIGMSNDVQVAIGLPFEAYQDMSQKIYALEKELSFMTEQRLVKSYRETAFLNIGFLEKIKFLFKIDPKLPTLESLKIEGRI